MTVAELERLAREQRATLLAFARSRARSREDAEDAVQQALTIALRVRERIDATTADRLHRRDRPPRGQPAARGSRAPPLARPAAHGKRARHAWATRSPTSRQVDVAELLDLLGALRDAKPDHARALMARGLGWRYREIADAFGWTYTKTNRCVTEGRAALRAARHSLNDRERPGAAPHPIHPAPAARYGGPIQ